MDHLPAFPLSEHTPGRHRTPRQAIGDDVKKIVVGGDGAAGGHADLKDATGEVTRFGEHLSSRGALSFAIIAMALRTFLGIDLFPGFEILWAGGSALLL